MCSARSRSPRRKNQSGMTLIEALMAASLLGIAFMGLTTSSLVLTRAAKSADMTSAATALASERLEVLRSMPLGAAGHNPGSYNGGTFKPNGAAGGPITIAWTVSAMNTPRNGLKTITVSASWFSTTNHNLQVSGY